jgi:hypothetical protein
MTETGDLQPLWDQLVGEDLSGIVFVRDYLQLQFNPLPQLNVYSSRVVASLDGRSAAFGEEAFANLAIGLIGKFVKEVKVDEEAFRILFENAAEIVISLRPEHYVGPEAVEFQGRDNLWTVL